MHKEDLIKYLAKKNRRAQHHYQEALNEILEGIQDQLRHGKEVRLMGFGTFYTRKRKASKAFHFKTKKPIQVAPLRQAAFRVGSLLKRAVRGKPETASKSKKKSKLGILRFKK